MVTKKPRWAAVWSDGELYYQKLEDGSNLTVGEVLWYASESEVFQSDVEGERHVFLLEEGLHPDGQMV